jgi:hypothetical protein
VIFQDLTPPKKKWYENVSPRILKTVDGTMFYTDREAGGDYITGRGAAFNGKI